MTRDEIEKLSDEELSVMVATEVMGWENSNRVGLEPPYYHDGYLYNTRFYGIPWNPSSDIAAAWQVVEKMQYFELEYQYGGSTMASVQFAGGEWRTAHADTAPLAICRAALLAKMQP